jgi:hypothetical protein
MSDETPPPDNVAAAGQTPASGPDPVEPAAPAPVCATCQASLDADQTYCLECGAPTPLAPGLRKRQRGLIAIATGALLLGGGAGALAYHLGSSDEGGSNAVTSGGVVSADFTTGTVGTLGVDTTFSGESTLPTVETGVTDSSTDIPSTDGTDTAGSSDTSSGTDTTFGTEVGTGVDTAPPDTSGLTDDTTGSTASTESTESTDTTTDLTPSSDDWPTGTDAWTVQVSSVRKRAGADRLVKRMTAAGKTAGVLASGDHGGFARSGYWVVFSGTFDTKAEAVAAKVTLGGAFGRTIVRRVRS